MPDDPFLIDQKGGSFDANNLFAIEVFFTPRPRTFS